MIQSHIILTQTYVNEEKIRQQVAASFFESGKIDITRVLNVDNYVDKYNHLFSQQRVLVMEFEDKDDFRSSLSGIYKKYSEPVMLFLGNLANYSTALQEGMLRLLEEPPQNLHIVLFAQSRARILPTIISRSQFYVLPESFVLQNLNNKIQTKVTKKLPQPGEVVKDLIANKFNFEVIKEPSKLEREEIDLWLWQLGIYLSQYYKQRPVEQIARKIQRVLEAQKLNNQNTQKKFVLASLGL
jgi:DNA polymerase III, delta subunit